jgi:uncharacterized protein HemX
MSTIRRLAAFLLLLAFALPCALPASAQFRNLEETARYNRQQQKKQAKAQRKAEKIQKRNIKKSAKGQHKADKMAAKQTAKDHRTFTPKDGSR